MHKLQSFFAQVQLPQPDSHKGQNGKLLIIGGSELFHAASKWSLDIASRFVDMVFYTSVPSNNELVNQAKAQFWNGIIIAREEVESYIEEADCVLIGPGMTRERVVNQHWTADLLALVKNEAAAPRSFDQLKLEINWDHDTYAIINYLLAKFPKKKWVVDAGALQMAEPRLFSPTVILTPHHKELETVWDHELHTQLSAETKQHLMQALNTDLQQQQLNPDHFRQVSQALGSATIVLKGHLDYVFNTTQFIQVEGGNAGMTKGGTGDVLAGLIAGLYACSDVFTAAVVGSAVNKMAGDALFTEVGPFFNASDLVAKIPEVLWQQLKN